MNEYMTLKEVAEKTGLDRSNSRKWLIKNGFSFIQVRDEESKQLVNALIIEDAERAIELRARQGFSAQNGQASPVVLNDNSGFFYVVQLMPDIAPNRIKIGFASSLPSRLDAHRTTCPRLELVKCWPCQRVFEPAVVAVAANGSAKLYGGEVYDVESLESMIERLDAFFSMIHN